MTSEKETKLHDQAIKEILAEVKRGEDRSKTLGTSGWQRPQVSSINKQFLRRTIFSAALSTNKTNRTHTRRSRLEKKSSEHHKRSSSVEKDQKHLKRSNGSSNSLSSSNSTLKKSRRKKEDQTKELSHKKAKIESVKS